MNKEIMKALGFDKEIEQVENGNCPLCGKEIDFHNMDKEFSDASSLREFKISGMCQKCQNSIFGA